MAQRDTVITKVNLVQNVRVRGITRGQTPHHNQNDAPPLPTVAKLEKLTTQVFTQHNTSVTQYTCVQIQAVWLNTLSCQTGATKHQLNSTQTSRCLRPWTLDPLQCLPKILNPKQVDWWGKRDTYSCQRVIHKSIS